MITWVVCVSATVLLPTETVVSSGNPLPPFRVLTPLQMSYQPAAPGGEGEVWEGCLARVRGPLASPMTLRHAS